MHDVPRLSSLALLNAGSSKDARIAMMAMTTNNSIKVKASAPRSAVVEGFILSA
jgi:hypothetical protein